MGAPTPGPGPIRVALPARRAGAGNLSDRGAGCRVGARGWGPALTLVTEDSAAADAAAVAFGKGQKAAHLAREHGLAACVVTPCRRGQAVGPVPSVSPVPPAPLWAFPLSTQQHSLSTALAQDGLEDAQERLGKLLFQVVLCVDGQAVLQHKEGVLQTQWPEGSHPGVRGPGAVVNSRQRGEGHWEPLGWGSQA